MKAAFNVCFALSGYGCDFPGGSAMKSACDERDTVEKYDNLQKKSLEELNNIYEQAEKTPTNQRYVNLDNSA